MSILESIFNKNPFSTQSFYFDQQNSNYLLRSTDQSEIKIFQLFSTEKEQYQPADQAMQLLSPQTLPSLTTEETQLIFQSIEKVKLPAASLSESKRSTPPPGFEVMTNASIEIQKAEKQRNVVYIRGFDNPLLTLQNIYNLLRNFGQVIRMLFFKQKGAVLTEFQSQFDASYCKKWLEGLKFCGNILKVFWSNHSRIECKPSQDSEFWEKQAEIIAKNPPCKTILVANLMPEACNELCLDQIFVGVGQILRVQFLAEQMCLVEFATIEQSAIAVAFRHATEIFGRTLSISFSKLTIQ